MEPWEYAVAGFLRTTIVPVIAAFLLAIPLWLIRKVYPPAEKYIYGPLENLCYAIGKIAGRIVRRALFPKDRPHRRGFQ